MIIWYYHRILPDDGSAAVSTGVFEKQMGYLKKSGYEFIDTEGLKEFFQNPRQKKRKIVMLTFDDGWADNLIWATPILAKFAAKAVIAVNTGLVNENLKVVRNEKNYEIISSKSALELATKKTDFSSFLTWNELAEMKKNGIWDIQAHGNSHLGCYHSFDDIKGFYPENKHWLMEYALGESPFEGAPRAKFISTLCSPRSTLSDEFRDKLRNSRNNAKRLEICRNFENPIKILETEKEFEKRLRDDFSECKRKLRKNLNVETDSLFWTWGQFSDTSIKIALECGFKMLFTTEKSPATEKTDPHMIPRIPAPDKLAEFKLQNICFTNSLLLPIRKVL